MNAVVQMAQQSPAVVDGQVLNPLAMIDRAAQSGASVETLERLMALQERYESAEARREFDEAVSLAKSEIPSIVKSRNVNYTSRSGDVTNYDYEDLAGIASVVDPILSKHGLSYRYNSQQKDGVLSVTCIVSHKRGHREETTLSGGVDSSGGKNAIQGVGSTVTYLQRYTLKLALGLSASKDDDGSNREKLIEGSQTITPDEFIFIRNLIDECEAVEEKVIASVGAKDFETMTQKQYREAVSKLQAWAKKKAQNATAK